MNQKSDDEVCKVYINTQLEKYFQDRTRSVNPYINRHHNTSMHDKTKQKKQISVTPKFKFVTPKFPKFLTIVGYIPVVTFIVKQLIEKEAKARGNLNPPMVAREKLKAIRVNELR